MRVESAESGARDDNGETAAKGVGGAAATRAQDGRGEEEDDTERREHRATDVGERERERERRRATRKGRETREKETTKQSGVPLCPAAQRRALALSRAHLQRARETLVVPAILLPTFAQTISSREEAIREQTYARARARAALLFPLNF